MSSAPTGPDGPPTPYEDLLYLLAEMEKVVERGVVVWPPDGAKSAARRVGKLFIRLVEIATRPPVH